MAGLPPRMGFPEEEIIPNNGGQDFYTCIVNGYRVFVWDHEPGWVLEVMAPKALARAWRMSLKQLFQLPLGRGNGFKRYRTIEKDALWLSALIHEVTTEGGYERL